MGIYVMGFWAFIAVMAWADVTARNYSTALIVWCWVMYIILACLHGFQERFEEGWWIGRTCFQDGYGENPSFGRTCSGIVYSFVWTCATIAVIFWTDVFRSDYIAVFWTAWFWATIGMHLAIYDVSLNRRRFAVVSVCSTCAVAGLAFILG